MTSYTRPMLILMLSLLLCVGCSTENPLCTDTYCVKGEIFFKEDLNADEPFDRLPATFSEQTIVDLLTVDVGEYTFEPVFVTGKVDWDFRSSQWQYRENNVTYLRKFTLEIETDAGRFGENRVLLLHLNKDTVIRDVNFFEHVDFLGTETVQLTHHIGIAEFKGDIVGAPTK